MNKDQILKLKLNELKAKCEELKLNTVGSRKTIFQEQLFEYYGIEMEDEEDEEDDEFETPANIQVQNFTLRDIQDSMNTFNGTDHTEIDHWLLEFEENANAVDWSDLQKFVYAKQLLRGAAQMFIRSQNNLNNWNKLKTALKKEFGTKLTSADRHRILRAMKKKDNESLLELLYRITEIAKPIEIDKESIIEYFVNAIPDSKNNKLILYEATDFDELKAKIKIYEKIRNYNQNNNRNDGRTKPESKNCIRCPHLRNHSSEECRKISGFCFKCNRRGHKAKECRALSPDNNISVHNNQSHRTVSNQINRSNEYPNNQHRNNQYNNNQTNENQHQTRNRPFNQQRVNQRANDNNNAVTNNVQANLAYTPIRLYKDASIENTKFKAFFDTGSDFSFISKSTFDKLENVELIPEKTRIFGIGQGVMQTLGYITTNLKLDNLNIQWYFHVANDADISFQVIIGNNILRVADINLDDNGAIFKLRNSNEINETKENRNEQGEYLNQTEQANSETTLENDFILKTAFKDLDTTQVEDIVEEKISHLPFNHKETFKNLINNYNPLQVKESPISMKIILIDDIPVRQPPRRLPLHHQKIVEDQVSEWLESGICKPSNSEYASPVVLVGKKDGKMRLCCDYRKLNAKIVKDNFPMTLIEDVLAKLQNSKLFTTLDLRNGFFHVPVDIDSQKFTSFVTHNGQFEFLKVPFGISNSPAVFCRYIATIFQKLIQDGTIITYMDDVIIPSENIEENLEKLERTLTVAKDYGIEINWEKCELAKTDITFLGYFIKNSTISPSVEKLKAVKHYTQPKDVKSLQRFLGLTSYFRRFINNYAIIARPLSDLLAKNVNFEFKDEQTIAFEKLKNSLINAPVLSLFNPSALTEVHTDASSYGYGAVMLQKDSEDQCFHPVEYMSRKTTPVERNYSAYELEVLAIINAQKKWRFYLLGLNFKLITDCNAFTQTIKKQDIPARVARWVMFLQQFTFTVEHRSGTKLKHADALSRLCALMTQNPLKNAIITAQQSDDFISAVKKILKDKKQFKDYFIKYDILFKDPAKELIVVPESMERECIEFAQRQGHFATKKTIELVQKHFYIKNLESKTEKFVKSCIECILINKKQGKKEGFLNVIDKSDKPLETYHVDHVGPLEETKKLYNHILVVVDGFAKFVWLYPTKSTGSEEVIDKLIKQSEIFGNPKRIISDRGTAFTSNTFSKYCSQNNIQHQLITTGVPRGNGQVERIHKTLITVLAKICIENPKTWYKHIGTVQQILNNTPSRSTKFTPFKIITGLDMRLKNNESIKAILETEEIKELNQYKEEIRELAKENIKKIQEENKNTYNRNRKKEREYEVNDLVAIKRTQFGNNLKIKPTYFGPYKILRKFKKGRYTVQKLGETEGPKNTTTVAEFMKPWQETRASP